MRKQVSSDKLWRSFQQQMHAKFQDGTEAHAFQHTLFPT